MLSHLLIEGLELGIGCLHLIYPFLAHPRAIIIDFSLDPVPRVLISVASSIHTRRSSIDIHYIQLTVCQQNWCLHFLTLSLLFSILLHSIAIYIFSSFEFELNELLLLLFLLEHFNIMFGEAFLELGQLVIFEFEGLVKCL